jgi:hypothetical protein
VSNVLDKIGAHSQLQALIFAVRHGIVDLNRTYWSLAPKTRQLV